MIGTILKGRYKIVGELGKGGFGETFLAEDLRKFNTRCVVKQFVIQNPNPTLEQSFRQRFELEAKTLMELGRENEQIPELYEYFSDGYLIQEFIVGKTLEKILAEDGPFPEERVKQILISLLYVLEDVHYKKKIHRDINPKNIILREQDDKCFLIDFGAVKEVVTLSAEHHLNTGSATIIIGTKGYIAPEQLEGFPECCSDLFSLGRTAQNLLTGKHPLLISAKDEGWRRYAPDVSESFASIINKAMQPKTHNRYATAAEMRNDLLSSRVVRLDDDEDDDTRPYNKGEPLVDMATGRQLVALKPPAGFRLPAEHRYLGEGKQSGEHLLYRNKDGQVVLYIPKDVGTGASFLIDRHPVTNSQFAAFLNDPEIKRRIRLTRSYDVAVAVTPDGRLLLADAPDFWERNRGKVLGKAAGLTCTSDRWVPVGGSEHLPVVLVSALGATWYASWLRNLSLEEVQTADGLPCESQWVSAALFDEGEGGLRQYPWGDDWDRQKLNSLSYWAGRDLDEWGAQYAVEAGPTAAGSFPEGVSPCGMMDAFGNVWEWLKNSDQSNRHMIKGGAFTSPKPVFEAATVFRQPDFVSHAIGFRCGWYV